MENHSNSDIDEQYALMQMLIDAIQGTSSFDLCTDFESGDIFNCLNLDYSTVGESGPADHATTISQTNESLSSFLACSAGMTTVMVRNVPKKCTQRMLLSDVISEGYGEAIDFVYLPTDISTSKNLGYAFVNFTHPYYAESFRKSFHKKHLSSMRGSRTGLSVSYAVIQGLEANVSNVLKNASVHRIRNPEYLPLVRDITRGGQLLPCVVKPPHQSPTVTPISGEHRQFTTPLRAH
jgi:hypothetical protein